MNNQEFLKLAKKERYALYDTFLDKKWLKHIRNNSEENLLFEDFCVKYRDDLSTTFINEVLKD